MDEATVIGTEDVNFPGENGQIKGKNVHLLEDINPKRGQGQRGFKIFLSDAKLATINFQILPGAKVVIFYNRFGRPESMRLVSDDDVVID